MRDGDGEGDGDGEVDGDGERKTEMVRETETVRSTSILTWKLFANLESEICRRKDDSKNKQTSIVTVREFGERLAPFIYISFNRFQVP